MKPHLRSLKKGQEIWALIEEVIALNEVVINFSGDLIRVQNRTERTLRVGQRVLLQVQGVQPLKLRLLIKSVKAKNPSALIDLTI